MRIALPLAASLLLAVPAASQDGPARATRPIDVPYVSQSELLCGGAAAAMLMRHAGLRGVYAEDFLPLVDRSRGGITAADLRDALAARGFDARAMLGTARLARSLIARGEPLVALIEDAPGRFHYVVVFGWHEGTVVYHDPARAPHMARREEDFDRAWAASRRWMLAARATPAAFVRPAAPGAPAPDPPARGPRAGALSAFEAGDYLRAAALAARATRESPDDPAAWRLLGASRYLAGDAARALDAWNRAGQPRIDLVRLSGLARTPHRTVERLMGVAPRSTLTRATLTLAARRLDLLPSAQAAKLSYVALPGGIVEVRGAIVERPLLPSRSEWMIEAARLPIDREIDLPLANVASAGDRLTGTWRFLDGQRRAEAAYRFPGPAGRGVWTVRAAWQQERFGAGAIAETERREAGVEWTDWIGGPIRLIAGAGVTRWNRSPSASDPAGRAAEGVRDTRSGTFAAVIDGGLELRPPGDRFAVTLRGTVAAGETSFASAAADARWTLPLGNGVRAAVSGGAGHVTSSAPPDAWPGAGSGRGRPLLLRAHPLFDDGRISGAVFGRTVAQGSIELQRDVLSAGLVSIAVAGFADAGRAWQRLDGSASPLHVDAGAGLRLRAAPAGGTIRIDWAHGLRDGNHAVSVGWVLGSKK